MDTQQHMDEPFRFPAVHEMREDEYRQQRERVEHAQDRETPHDVYASRDAVDRTAWST